MNLIIRLVAGIIAGLLIGQFAPEAIIRLLLTIKLLVGEFINFLIPLIIIFFIGSGIASLKSRCAKTLSLTVAIAYGSTIIAGTLAAIASLSIAHTFVGLSNAYSVANESLSPYLSFELTPLVDVISALVMAFLFGVGINITKANTLATVFEQGRDIIDQAIGKVVIPLLPVFIAGIFTEMTASGNVFATLSSFGVVLLLAITLHWLWLLALFLFAGATTARNPVTALKQMLPAYLTALGTMSSAATIPVTLKQVKANKVAPGIANFTVPLCANIHLSGSTITIVTCTIAVMTLTSHLANPHLSTIFPFILVLAVTMIAAPGVPGGAVMAALGILGSMLDFDHNALGLMIALYVAQDSFGTACNVTGDGAIAMLVNQYATTEQTSALEDKAPAYEQT